MRIPVCALMLSMAAVSSAQSPVLPAAGVVNTADYTPNIAPGSLISLFGGNLASAVIQAAKPPLAKTLGGAAVELNDGSGAWTALPLFFVSPGQINAQFPFAYAGKTVQLRVRNAAGTSAAAAVTVQAAAPRLLTKTMDGKGEALLTDAIDYKFVTAAVPARGDEYLTLYLTGLGAVGGAAVAGNAAGDGGSLGPLSPATAAISVTIGGKAGRVTWAGLAPGWVGLYQVNVQVAPDTPFGQQPIVVSSAGAFSQQNVTLTVSDSATTLTEASISPAGGVVSSGGVQLTIPAGTVASNTVVRISRIAGRTAVANQGSDVYVVRGLPRSLTTAVRITLPTNPGVDPAKTLVVTRQLWGAGDFSPPDAAPTSANAFRSFEVSQDEVSGVTITLPPAPEAPADQSDTEIETFVLQNYGSALCPGGSDFLLFFPNSDPVLTGHFDKICGWLTEAKQKVASQTGLVFGPGRNRWPFRVVYGSFDAGSQRWGEHVPGANGDINYDSVRLNSDQVKTFIAQGKSWENELRATIGHELLHFVQNAYDARPASTVAATPHRDLWYEEAMSTWFEGIMLGQDNYISESVRAFAWPFGFYHGLEYPAPASCTWGFLRVLPFMPWGDNACSDVQDSGYGASLLLRNIAKAKGGKVLGDVMQQSLSGQKTAAQALNAAVGSLYGNWTQLARSLVESTYNTGESWPPPAALSNIARTTGVDLIPSTSDPARKNFTDTWNAQDLSMHLDRITFSETLPAGAALTLKFAQKDANVFAYLYRYQNQAYNLVDMFSDSYTLYNADQLSAAKAVYLVLVIQGRCLDECTGTLPVSLSFQTAGLLDWILSTKKVDISFDGPLKFTDPKTGKSCGGGSTFGTIDMGPSSQPIAWGGTTFSAAVSGPGWPDPHWIVSIAATGALNKDGTAITSLSFQETSTDGTAYRLSVTGIPIVTPVGGFTEKTLGFHFKLTGSAAASATTATMTVGSCIATWTPSDPSGDGVEVLLFKN